MRWYGHIITVLLVVAPLAASAQAVQPVVNIENTALKMYLDDSDYDVNDYSYTNMSRYSPRVSRVMDRPAPVTFRWNPTEKGMAVRIGLFENGGARGQVFTCEAPGEAGRYDLYNLIPGRTYRYSLTVPGTDGLPRTETGQFFVEGRRRMIRVDGIANVRDFGGMRTTDGRALVFGRLYRGEAMDSGKRGVRTLRYTRDGGDVLRYVMAVSADIDLRNNRELLLTDGSSGNDMDSSPLGPDVEYHHCGIPDFGGVTSANRYGAAIAAVVSCLEKGKNVYVHCAWGADRTGALSFFLGAMAGVDENELARDYELTCLSHGGKARHSRDAVGAYNYAPSMAYFKRYFQGGTLAEKVCDYLVKRQGVTEEQIMSFRRIMTGDGVYGMPQADYSVETIPGYVPQENPSEWTPPAPQEESRGKERWIDRIARKRKEKRGRQDERDELQEEDEPVPADVERQVQRQQQQQQQQQNQSPFQQRTTQDGRQTNPTNPNQPSQSPFGSMMTSGGGFGF